MGYDVKAISKWFLEHNNDAGFPSLNGHLKLQKLLYYAQAMNLAVYGNPLFENRIEAWENGPVVKDMFIEYRHNNFAEYARILPSDFEIQDEKVLQLLNIVNHIYGTQSGQQLVELTHSEEPWKELEVAAQNRMNPEITKDKIKNYYQPLKDVFLVYEDYDFSNEKTEKINGNVFVYNLNETELDENDFRNLWDIGMQVNGEKFFVYKDEENELVIY